MIPIYFVVLIGLFLYDMRTLLRTGEPKERILYVCLMLAAVAAGIFLWLAPTNFSLVG